MQDDITTKPATGGIRDNPNINVMVLRADNWERFVTEPVVDLEFLKRIDGSTATIPVTAELYRQFYDFPDEKVNNDVYHATTHQSYLNLIDKKNVDLIFVTEPSEEELAYARSKGVELEVVPFTREAFVFIVNEENLVHSLSVGQIQDIYMGRHKSWSELGGGQEVIYAFQREPNSGSQTAMEKMVMQEKQLAESPQAQMIMGMGDLVCVVADYENYPGAIGYTYKYYLNNLYHQEGVRILSINGVSPTDENLINGSYPFATNYYVVIRKDEPEDSQARKLRDWLLTEEGQRLVEMCGYCRM